MPDSFRLTVPYGCRLVEREPLCENAFGTVTTLSYLTPAGQMNKTLGLKKTRNTVGMRGKGARTE